MSKLGLRTAAGERFYWIWCPACDEAVMLSDKWEWNGDSENPTISPSILITGTQWGHTEDFYKPKHSSVPRGERIICHSFLTNGVWEFLGDSTHDKVGQKMPAVDLPEWLLG